MNKTTQRILFAAAIGAVLLAHASVASAHELAGLQVRLGESIDAVVRADVESALDETMESLSYWSWIPARQARSSMNPVVRDCFTGDCLTKAGEATGASAGLRVTFSGESQIYDWQLDVYNLNDGSLLRSEKGACELCGRSEVVREFKKSLTETLNATRMPAKASASKSRSPRRANDTPTREPDVAPEESAVTDEPTTPVETEQPEASQFVMLEISVQPADATIKMEGEQIGVGTATVSLRPGTYELRFAREGYQGFKETFVVGAQTPRKSFMRIHMSKTDPDPVVVEPSEGAIDRLGNQRVTYGVLSLAVGGVLLGTGMWLNYLDGRPACEEGEFTECPELYNTGAGAFVTTLGGAALVTGGAILLAWDLLAGTKEKSARITPMVGPDGVGLGLVGQF